jgi:cell division protein FtsQ
MTAVAQPMPVDVRLMNVAASLLYAAVAVAIAAAALGWAARHPLFALSRIVVEGDVSHSSAATLRANVAPRLSGNFFTVDLAQARAAFEDVPWVRLAIVRREFPNVLRVNLQEHQPVAFWGAEGGSTLVNSFGEVFEANVGAVETDFLPRLWGPQAQAAQVLATWRAIAPMFEHLDLQVESLTLTGRGSWQAVLDTGGRIELGRGRT